MISPDARVAYVEISSQDSLEVSPDAGTFPPARDEIKGLTSNRRALSQRDFIIREQDLSSLAKSFFPRPSDLERLLKGRSALVYSPIV